MADNKPQFIIKYEETTVKLATGALIKFYWEDTKYMTDRKRIEDGNLGDFGFAMRYLQYMLQLNLCRLSRPRIFYSISYIGFTWEGYRIPHCKVFLHTR